MEASYNDLINYCKHLKLKSGKKRKDLIIKSLIRYFKNDVKLFEEEFKKWKLDLNFESKPPLKQFLDGFQLGYSLNHKEIKCFWYKSMPEYEDLASVYFVYVHVLNSIQSVKELPHELPVVVHWYVQPKWNIILNPNYPLVMKKGEIIPYLEMKNLKIVYDCSKKEIFHVEYLSTS